MSLDCSLKVESDQLSHLKLPIPDDLHTLVFTFLEPIKLQSFVTVNKFWCKTIILGTTTQQTEKIKAYIESIRLLSKLYVNDSNKKTYGKVMKELDVISQPILDGCIHKAVLKNTNLKSIRISLEKFRKIFIEALIPLEGLENLKSIKTPFFFDNVIEMASLYHQYEEGKKIENDAKRDFLFSTISESLLKNHDPEGAIVISRSFSSERSKLYSFQDIAVYLLKIKNFKLAFEVACEANDSETIYKVAKSAALHDECKIALEFSLKISDPLIRSEILKIVARTKADKGESVEAEEIAKSLTLHYLDKHNITLLYVQTKRLEAMLQQELDARDAKEKRFQENCAIM